MKLFRIFAVGLIISAVVVATAVAPISSAESSTPPPNGLFVSPNIDVSSFNSAVLNYTSPATTTTGPTSDPPEADVVPNFSGLVVNGPTAIDGDDDGTEDIIIDEDGEIFINNKFEVDANADGDEELEINSTFVALGSYPGGAHMLIATAVNMIQIRTNDGYLSVESPYIDFTSGSGADVKFQIDGDLTVTGSIRSHEAIGSYYRKAYTSLENTVYSGSVACKSGDHLIGCSAYAGTDTAIQGTKMTLSTCYGYSVGSKKIRVFAMCFDPDGETSGYQ